MVWKVKVEMKMKIHNAMVSELGWHGYRSNDSPAGELSLRPAQRHAVLPGGEAAPLLDVLRDHEALHWLEGPGPAAGGRGEAELLNVDGEHRKLGGGQAACQTQHYENKIFYVNWWMRMVDITLYQIYYNTLDVSIFTFNHFSSVIRCRFFQLFLTIK